MTLPPAQPPKKWRSAHSIRANRSLVDKAIKNSRDGKTVTLDVSTAIALVEICAQAEHTERNHERPEPQA